MQLDITVCKLWCTIIKYQWWCCGCILCFLWLRVYWTRLVCNMFYDCGILVASALPTDGNNPKNLKPDDDFVNLFSNAWCARWKTRSSQNIWCNCFFLIRNLFQSTRLYIKGMVSTSNSLLGKLVGMCQSFWDFWVKRNFVTIIPLVHAYCWLETLSMSGRHKRTVV